MFGLDPDLSPEVQSAFQLRFHVTDKGHAVVYAPWCPLASKRTGQLRRPRYVLWAAGIEIPIGHIVHHRDGIKLNDRPSNLEVLSNGGHTKEHWQGDTSLRRQRISEALVGRVVSKETRRKIALAGLGKTNAAGKRKPEQVANIRAGSAERERRRHELEKPISDQVKLMYGQGVSPYKIGPALGISVDRVYRMLKRS